MSSVLASILLATAFGAPRSEPPAPPPQDAPNAAKAVLVTGASTGIGRVTVEHLAANGFFVYACARKEKDLEALGAIANVQAIRLDVTKQDEIDAAVKTVREAGRGLFGVVNNAGVVVLGPLVELRDDDLRHQFEVNVLGPFRVTKAFAPLLIESKGRVTTTGSLSGTVTWPMGGAYTMSKHAIEAYTETLAAELAPFGVGVSVIEPGNYRSDIMKTELERLRGSGYSAEGSLYADRMKQLLDSPATRQDEAEPDDVARAFHRALTDAKPARRYLVVPNEREAEITIRAAIRRVVSLNAEQAYAYDREKLIEMLDEALKAK
jgi:NAD(P)-dependent dehydrogenase (short-subunit alcohol dehydrogenase family)